MAKAKYDARKAIKEAIRACGKKPTDFTVREINEWAEALTQY
jgi:uncharacterized protein (DUF1778 family)